MPEAQYRALVEEYFRDYHIADLRATIMNASGNYKQVFTALELIGETREDKAPVGSEKALTAGLRAFAQAKRKERSG